MSEQMTKMSDAQLAQLKSALNGLPINVEGAVVTIGF